MRSRRHNSAGFTLLELVLVLLIVALMTGLAAPTFRTFALGHQSTNTATQLVALTRWAHSQAIAQALTYQLNMDSSAGTFWVSLQGPENAKPNASGESAPALGRIFKLPDGCRLESDAPLDQGRMVVHFFPNGRTEAATIRIVDSHGAVEVVCPSASESYRLATSKEAP